MPDLTEEYPNQYPGDADNQTISSAFGASESPASKRNKLKRFAKERIKKAEEDFREKHPSKWTRAQWKRYIIGGLAGSVAAASIISGGKMLKNFLLRRSKSLRKLVRPKKISIKKPDLYAPTAPPGSEATTIEELRKRILASSQTGGQKYWTSPSEKKLLADQIAKAKGNAGV